jgi:hypothetical protein
MATLSVQIPSQAGSQVTFQAAAGGGDEFPNSGYVRLVIKNDDASSKTVTVVGGGRDNYGLQGTFLNQTIVVPAGQMHIAGPFVKNRYDDVDGFVQLTYSAVTSLSVAAIAV